MDESKIDELLISTASFQWQKLAMVVAKLMDSPEFDFADTSGPYITKRIYFLIQSGKLESQGDIENWRFSEIRLSNQNMEIK